MSVVGPAQVPIEVISGLVTNIDPASLPSGVSPDCADIAFKPGVPGTVQTRPGTSLVHTFAGTPTLNYLSTFTDLQGNNRNLYLDSTGNLWQEYPQSTFVIVNHSPRPAYELSPGMRAQSDTAFGREFIAFNDGQYGINIPRQWDSANFDRVSQCGPGEGPVSVMDVSFVLTHLSRTAGIISGTTSAPHGLTPGVLVNINGVAGDATFDGQFPVATTPTSTTFTAWGVPGQYAPSLLVRHSNVVTATFASPPFFAAASQIIIANADDPSFNGIFTVSSVIGNTVTWPQAAANKTIYAAQAFSKTITVPVVSFLAATGSTSTLTITIQVGQTDPFVVGSTVILAGNSGANGTYTVNAVFDGFGGVPLTANPRTSGLAIGFAAPGSSGYGGTATLSLPNSSPSPTTGLAGLASRIVPGVHSIAVSFVLRSGYITAPSPIISWNSAGGFTAKITGIPLGPDIPTIGRLIIATPAGGQDYFYSKNGASGIAAMYIPDNTTTTLVLDFSDIALINSVQANDLFDLIQLPEVAGFIQFGSRLLSWGARNMLQNWQNLSFDGGWDQSSSNRPLGWTTDPTNGGGALKVTNSTIWGDAYSITGDGATAIRGMITQPAALDTFGVTRIEPGVGYSVRVLLSYQAGIAPQQGAAHIHLFSASAGVDTGLDVFISDITDTFTEFIGVLTAGLALSATPGDLLLRLYVDGTPANGAAISFENVEIFPTNEPYQSSVLYGSNIQTPEAVQGTTGFINVNENDGRRIVSCRIIRDRLYIFKNDGGIFSTTEDSSAEFSDWTVDTISLRVGCESINGLGAHETDTGEDWFFVFSRTGFYVFWGTEPVKVSQEIQPTWEQINWAAADTAWVVVDVANRRALVGVPMGDATSPNKILQMDYKMCGATAQTIAEASPVSSTYTGQLKAHASSRKWTIWNLVENCAGFIERTDGTAHLFFGNGAGNGKLYDLLESNMIDADGPINGYWITAPIPSDEQKKQDLQMKGNRVLLRYLTSFIEGNGTLQITIYGPGFVNSQVIPISGAPPLILASVASQDLETYTNFSAERVFLKFQAVDETEPWFSLQNGQIYISEDPVAPIRGFN